MVTIDQNSIKITDIITTEYADFLSFCAASGKTFTSELTNFDYVAFRTSSGQSREYINKIRSLMENPVIHTPNSSNNGSFIDAQVEARTETKLSTSGSLDDTKKLDFQLVTVEDDVDPTESSEPEVNIERESCFVIEEAEPVFKEDINTPETISPEKKASDKTNVTPKRIKKFDIPLNPEYSLAYLFGVEASDFSDINVDQLYLSVRASNCLKSAKYTTLEDVLSKNVSELQGIRNMGIKSVNEIVQKAKDFVSNHTNIAYISQNKIDLLHKITGEPIDGELKTAVEALLVGEEYKTNGLTDHQLERFNKLRAAVSEVGEEICLAAYLDPQYSLQICDMLLKFAAPYIQYQNMIEDAFHSISLLSDSMKARKALPFIKAYEVKAGE